eukprot:CAMPEP_0206525850 /NCGR_PEP_ID=MMETSP0325_2-20121206/316_1 /ASSEMBLY_ACC=CAM_ASM_000347 /TAXON_ID=2866 /ORGANISM="Crypthecodinium cohnii, Strain Seligo" /LENGTH=177 /DNA_ID=CAMNT_0054020783 /DNA_START=43 /DNA_END=574 /DNA_ORIENTATION=-
MARVSKKTITFKLATKESRVMKVIKKTMKLKCTKMAAIQSGTKTRTFEDHEDTKTMVSNVFSESDSGNEQIPLGSRFTPGAKTTLGVIGERAVRKVEAVPYAHGDRLGIAGQEDSSGESNEVLRAWLFQHRRWTWTSKGGDLMETRSGSLVHAQVVDPALEFDSSARRAVCVCVCVG